MKLYILIAASLLVFSAPAGAVSAVSGGFKTGLNISTFVGSDADYSGESKIARAGFVVGGFLIFPIDAPFNIQAEALISSKGAVYKWDLLGTLYENRVKLTYLELPVLARFDFKSRGDAKPSLLIGPSLGFKLSAKGESRTVGSHTSSTLEHIRGFDPGIVVGGTVEIATSKGSVLIETRYTRSLSSIDDHSGSTAADIKNSVATLMLGYRF